MQTGEYAKIIVYSTREICLTSYRSFKAISISFDGVSNVANTQTSFGSVKSLKRVKRIISKKCESLAGSRKGGWLF